MAEILSGSIDLNLIDKNKVKVVTKKDGTIAKYYDVSVFIKDEADQYNNIATISPQQTKEERQAKVKPIYLANLKLVWESTPPTLEKTASNGEIDDQSLPF
jgi:hypothetical protein